MKAGVWAAGAVTEPIRLKAVDFLTLTKPGITAMVVLTTLLSFLVAASGGAGYAAMGWTLLGTGLCSAGAAALNMTLERNLDARMLRTQNRPLPAGRLSVREAAVFGTGLCAAGLTGLAIEVNVLTAMLSGATLLLYLFGYTPLKRRAWWCLIVGAVPGAFPILMGWAAARGDLQTGAWLMFALLFLWQFPHFLALAWLHRDDYLRAGLPMISVIDSDGSRSARQAVVSAALLLAMSVEAAHFLAGTVSAVFVGATGVAFLACALTFALHRSRTAARRLFLASVAYLPIVLIGVAAPAIL